MKEKIRLNEEYVIREITFLINDAPMNYFYGKDVFLTSGFGDSKPILVQILGNLGAYTNDYELDSSINVFIISEQCYNQLKDGMKDKILTALESKLNSKGQSFKDLLIITENSVIDFAKKRTLFYKDQVTQSLLNSLQV
jgi:hypothetical protein